MNKFTKILTGFAMVFSANLTAGGGDFAGGLAGGMMGGVIAGAMTSPREKTVIVQTQAPTQAPQNTAELDRARTDVARAEDRAARAEKRAEDLEKKVDGLTSKIDELVSKLDKQQGTKEDARKGESSWWSFSK